VGWVREGDPQNGRRHGAAIVVCNGDQDGEKHMEVGREHANETWVDFLGWYDGKVQIAEDGWADFKCHSMSVSIWVAEPAASH